MRSGSAIVQTVRGFLAVCVLFLCAASVALGQAGRGSISGLVTDPGGAVIQGAKVTLLNPATGATQHTVTSSAGLYTFVSLNAGVYKVTASQTGFKSAVQDKITVNLDRLLRSTLRSKSAPPRRRSPYTKEWNWLSPATLPSAL